MTYLVNAKGYRSPIRRRSQMDSHGKRSTGMYHRQIEEVADKDKTYQWLCHHDLLGGGAGSVGEWSYEVHLRVLGNQPSVLSAVPTPGRRQIVILRRSARLQASGYYGRDGKPVISYKETPNRKLWTRSRAHPRKAANHPNNDIAAGDMRPEAQRGNDVAWRFIIPICILALCVLCLFIHQMMDGSTPSNSLSGHSREMLKNIKIKSVLSSCKELICNDDKSPLWMTVPNYALESSGASVPCKDTSPSYKVRPWPFVSFLGLEWDFGRLVRPRVVIEGNLQLNPGKCWAFAGQQGILTVALSHPVRVTSVTLGHITKAISPTGHIQDAPKDFSVYGLESSESAGVNLGNFTYDENGPMFQNFRTAEKDSAGVSTHVRLSVHSNWGDPTYTCLYNFRVHGDLAS
ncbi:uncharacterized protein LOC144022316 [Festucalex cinctus]